MKIFLILVFYFTFIFFWQQCFAQSDIEGLEPEVDIGLSVESIPASKDLEIPQLTLKAASGKLLIDGHINDPFWEPA